MTLAQLQAYVGPPPTRGGVVYAEARGELAVVAWTDRFCDADGWWVAVTRGERVLSIVWSAGGLRSRNLEIDRAVDRFTRGLPS